MSKIKFVPNLFLEVAELNRFQKFLDTDGFRKHLLQDSVKFGLIKSNLDTDFLNGRVQRDVDTNTGQKTLKIAPLYGIDSNGNFIYSPQITGIPIVNDTNWYWVKVRYQPTTRELGTVSIAVNGDMVGVGTEFTKVLRGQPNFPSKIKLVDSTYNTLEYEVLEVIDDTHAILGNPATNTSGIAEFQPESDLHYAVIGTFTPGVNVPSNNKYPFQYDSMYYELVPEVNLNTKPTPYSQGTEFYIARYRISGANVIIQDKRVEYWETKGSQLHVDIERGANPLIGVEAIKWQNVTNPANENIVQIAWGMRSSNWSVNSSQNILTINTGLGGKYKTVDDFNDGDFDGWRVYTDSNGKYSRVISSVKQGGAINLTLDVLDVDDYSIDGGNTYNIQEVLIVPNCEEVEINCRAWGTFPNGQGISSAPNSDKKFTFPVNTAIARLDLEVYYDPSCFYIVHYRYKNEKEYTNFTLLPSDTVGYYTEVSFSPEGYFDSGSAVRYPYTANDQLGYIKLNISPIAYQRFKSKVDKGDIIGVNVLTNFSSSVINLNVGTDKNYQYITGNIALSGDVFFNLGVGLTDGNEFRIHFDCTDINLGGYGIYIVTGYAGGSNYTLIKKITVGDVYEMKNRDGGIIFDLVYTGSKWACSQNYDLGTPYEIKQMDGVISSLFDTGSGFGKVKGTYGLVLCNAARTVNGITIPNLSYRFLLGQGTLSGNTVNVGDTGGEKDHTLTTPEIPSHTHTGTTDPHSHGATTDPHNHGITPMQPTFGAAGAPGGQLVYANDGGTTTTQNATVTVNIANATANFTTQATGGSQSHNNMPPYYALIFAKKVY